MPEADVGRDDADQRHAREVVPLGDHLRADQDVDLAVAKPRQQRVERALAADRVAIDPRDARGRARRPRLRPRPARCRSRSARDTAPRTAGTSSAPAPSSCSSGSAPGAPTPRREPSATRCSSGTRACRRTAGRTPRSRSRGGSAGPAPARRARAAAADRARQRPAQHHVGPAGRVLLAHVDDASPSPAAGRARGARATIRS